MIFKQKNKGSANATNQGIKMAKMKYIKFLDADDVILSNSTKILIDILEKNSNVFLLLMVFKEKLIILKM